jgi:hypothetical protein
VLRKSNRLTAADFLLLCRAAIRAAERAPDAISARRHALHAMRLATLGERQARRETLRARQRTGLSSN